MSNQRMYNLIMNFTRIHDIHYAIRRFLQLSKYWLC